MGARRRGTGDGPGPISAADDPVMPSDTKTSERAFALKGRMQTLTVLHLLSTDRVLLERQLATTVRQAPQFFDGLAIVLDVGQLGQAPNGEELDAVVRLMRQHGLMPVGVQAADGPVGQAAKALGLALLGEQGGRDSGESKSVDTAPDLATAAAEPTAPVCANLVIRRPVRSGVQVYARGGDLIVTAPVSRGAEVLADGNIHVYGPLRGRALAGVNGDVGAMIFCQDMDAELISIAGQYRVNDSFKDSERGVPARIFLDDDRLVVARLD